MYYLDGNVTIDYMIVDIKSCRLMFYDGVYSMSCFNNTETTVNNKYRESMFNV